MEKVVSEAEELPLAIVRRVVKGKLGECSDAGDISLHKDALLAFSASARIFIHYLSATANDICKESKRQTISSDDVLKALEEIEFPEFVGPLKASLNEFRKKNAGKKAEAIKAKEVTKKRKAEDDSSSKNGRSKVKDVEDNENEENHDNEENEEHQDSEENEENEEHQDNEENEEHQDSEGASVHDSD